jgi:5-methylcytosine-specific restriction endonuclease McrA
MTVVVAGGGINLSHTPKTKHVRRKGISANRSTYDRRRRLSTRSDQTLQFMDILRADPCAFCGAAADTNRQRISDVDHIVPLSRDGLDRWENMTAACAPCNRGRKDTDVLTYLARRASCTTS